MTRVALPGPIMDGRDAILPVRWTTGIIRIVAQINLLPVIAIQATASPHDGLERNLAGGAGGDDAGKLPLQLGRSHAVLGR